MYVRIEKEKRGEERESFVDTLFFGEIASRVSTKKEKFSFLNARVVTLVKKVHTYQ